LVFIVPALNTDYLVNFDQIVNKKLAFFQKNMLIGFVRGQRQRGKISFGKIFERRKNNCAFEN